MKMPATVRAHTDSGVILPAGPHQPAEGWENQWFAINGARTGWVDTYVVCVSAD